MTITLVNPLQVQLLKTKPIQVQANKMSEPSSRQHELESVGCKNRQHMKWGAEQIGRYPGGVGNGELGWLRAEDALHTGTPKNKKYPRREK